MTVSAVAAETVAGIMAGTTTAAVVVGFAGRATANTSSSGACRSSPACCSTSRTCRGSAGGCTGTYRRTHTSGTSGTTPLGDGTCNHLVSTSASCDSGAACALGPRSCLGRSPRHQRLQLGCRRLEGPSCCVLYACGWVVLSWASDHGLAAVGAS